MWARGPSTVRDVHDTLTNLRDIRYTTSLKTLQVMTAKGLVKRDASDRAHVYEAATTEEEVQEEIVSHMLDRVFSGSASKLVFRALSAKGTSPTELDEIRKMLDTLKGESHESD